MLKSTLTRRPISGLVFGFLVILGLALFSDIRAVRLHISTFRWGLYPLVLGLTAFNYLLRGIKFHYYLRQIGAKDISLGESFRLFVAGFPLAVTPGKVGEALKGVWIHTLTGVPTAQGIAVVVAERISDGLAVLLLSTLGVIAYPRYWPAFGAVLVLLVGLLVVSQIRPLALALLDLAARLPLVRRLAPGLRDFYEGSYTLFKPGITLVAVGLGTISWLGEGLGFFLILVGLGGPVTAERLSLAVFVLAFSTVVGAVTALPGGLGAAEASISGMLVLLAGLTSGTAAAATLLIRFATLWFGVALGLGVWAASRDKLSFSQPATRSQETPDAEN
ncbi:MAG: flippase-like domain-containing protein [Anaerolineales bacterium]|nr:flippase-like domain-containing protein [Anaerolineales bacterium]